MLTLKLFDLDHFVVKGHVRHYVKYHIPPLTIDLNVRDINL